MAQLQVENELPADIVSLMSEVDDPDEGFFGPDSMMWELGQENILFLAGVAPILLQVAHPMVSAAGVEHSDYDEDLQGRFQTTFDVLDTIVFGDLDTAVKATMFVRRTHDEVVGELPSDAGKYDEGDKYFANNPELLLWVHATLIDQSLVGYETYVQELNDTEKQQYYEESQVFGRLMGIPKDMYPETIEGFYDYYEKYIEKELVIGETGEEVIENFFGAFGLAAPFMRFLGTGTMPEPAEDLFEEYGLKSNVVKDLLFRLFAGMMRLVPLSLLPSKIRYREKYRDLRLNA